MATTPTPTATPTKAPDAAADQAKLLLLIATDWLNNDRTHQEEITRLVAALTPPAGV